MSYKCIPFNHAHVELLPSTQDRDSLIWKSRTANLAFKIFTEPDSIYIPSRSIIRDREHYQESASNISLIQRKVLDFIVFRATTRTSFGEIRTLLEHVQCSRDLPRMFKRAEPPLRSLKFHFLTVLRRTLDDTYAAGYSYTIFYPLCPSFAPSHLPSTVMTSLPPRDATSSMPRLRACFPLTSSATPRHRAPPPDIAVAHMDADVWKKKEKCLLNNDVKCFASMRYFKADACASLT
jgi:hypothetical protein